jgi:hypothetical protein
VTTDVGHSLAHHVLKGLAVLKKDGVELTKAIVAWDAGENTAPAIPRIDVDQTSVCHVLKDFAALQMATVGQKKAIAALDAYLITAPAIVRVDAG